MNEWDYVFKCMNSRRFTSKPARRRKTKRTEKGQLHSSYMLAYLNLLIRQPLYWQTWVGSHTLITAHPCKQLTILLKMNHHLHHREDKHSIHIGRHCGAVTVRREGEQMLHSRDQHFHPLDRGKPSISSKKKANSNMLSENTESFNSGICPTLEIVH